MNNALPDDIIFDQRPLSYESLQLNELLRLNSKNIRSPEELKNTLLRASYEVKLDHFITADPAMLEMKNNVQAILRLPHNNKKPVIITGPSGTGKEIIARAFSIKDKPFVAQNCAAFPKDLIASLLFGHMKGAFTGAIQDTHGLFIQASDGVVFLDEIGDLPLEAQAMLLRVLQSRVVSRLGEVAEHEVNCRIICATKRNLRQMVELGSFREDLFARLMAFELHITGLQDRPSDIQLIAKDGFDVDNNPLNYQAAIPPHVLPDIYRYNVRAIQAFVARMRTYGRY